MAPSSLNSLRNNIAILIAVVTAFAIVSFSVLFLRLVQLAMQIAAEENEEISLEPPARITNRSASSAITPETRMALSDSAVYKRTPTTK